MAFTSLNGWTTPNAQTVTVSANQATVVSGSYAPQQPPTITAPVDMTLEATGPTGAQAFFSATAVDSRGGALTPVLSPTSGSVFALGTNTVTVQATDGWGNSASNTFKVIVRDTTPPVISTPPNSTVYATTATGAYVTFSTFATDLVSGSVPSVSIPPSGSFFLMGSTSVVTSATDGASNSASKNFTITVTVQPVTASETHAPRAAVSGSYFQVTVHPSVPGRTYQLQRSDILTSGSWQSIGTPKTGDGSGDVVLSDTINRTMVPRRFFRKLLGP